MTLPLLTRFAKDLYHCSDCGYCVDAVWAERGLHHVCATLQSHAPQPGYSGRGFLLAARAWHEGQAIDAAALGERVFACATCGHCETVCPIGLRPAQIGQALRGELWARDEVPDAVRAHAEALARDGNPCGRPRAARAAWEQDPAATSRAADAEAVLYLPGCAAALAVPEEARAARQLLQAAGCAVMTLGEADSCCGAPWHELGREEEAAALLRALAARCAGAHTRYGDANAGDGGADTGGVGALARQACEGEGRPDDHARSARGLAIVGGGLECLRAWRRQPGSPTVPVQSFIDWIATRHAAGRLTLRARTAPLPAVRVLDSCQARGTPLARTLRELLAALGVTVQAETTAPDHVICCGAAGGLPATQPASARRMAEARLVPPVAARELVSPDPRCVAHLRQAVSAAGNAATDPTRILGPAEFLWQYFEAVT